MSLKLLVLGAFALAFEAAPSFTKDKGSRPHVIVMLADNLGWSNVGFHQSVPTTDIQTPNIDKLAYAGIELDRHYTYKFCSPSRSAFLSGRLSYHVNIFNDDPTRPGAGIPVDMTLVSDKLKEANYSTHMLGTNDL